METEMNALLKRIRELYSRTDLTPEEVDELREKIMGLDDHLTCGGDFPRDWKPF